MRARANALLVVGTLLFVSAVRVGAEPQVIKLATLAPEGSVWHKVLKDMVVKYRNLAGGLQGGEVHAGATLQHVCPFAPRIDRVVIEHRRQRHLLDLGR